uniref:Putative ovule protein n=1 Tax=Solanum chacoense TaxID=4108 RepID=A0A0V0H4F1_SOLCH
MSMIGELNFFLELQIKQTSKSTFVCQEMYKKLLKKFHILDAKKIDTPIGTNSKLDVDGSGPDVNDASVRIYAKFQYYPMKSHLKAAKRILRCLKKTRDLVLLCPSKDFFI